MSAGVSKLVATGYFLPGVISQGDKLRIVFRLGLFSIAGWGLVLALAGSIVAR